MKIMDQPYHNPQPPADNGGKWVLYLYIAGQTPRSILALNNLKKICEEFLQDDHQLEVIDLLAEPQMALRDQIVAVPTLVRHFPRPLRRVIGDLSDTRQVLTGLQLETENAVEQSGKAAS